jgi:hypothetical protein
VLTKHAPSSGTEHVISKVFDWADSVPHPAAMMIARAVSRLVESSAKIPKQGALASLASSLSLRKLVFARSKIKTKTIPAAKLQMRETATINADLGPTSQ